MRNNLTAASATAFLALALVAPIVLAFDLPGRLTALSIPLALLLSIVQTGLAMAKAEIAPSSSDARVRLALSVGACAAFAWAWGAA